MHIHGNLITLSAMNPYSAAADRAINSAQKAASVRKKLATAAAETVSSSSPEEEMLVAAFAGAAHPQKLPGDEHHSSDTGKDSGFG